MNLNIKLSLVFNSYPDICPSLKIWHKFYFCTTWIAKFCFVPTLFRKKVKNSHSCRSPMVSNDDTGGCIIWTSHPLHDGWIMIILEFTWFWLLIQVKRPGTGWTWVDTDCSSVVHVTEVTSQYVVFRLIVTGWYTILLPPSVFKCLLKSNQSDVAVSHDSEILTKPILGVVDMII